MGEIPKDPVMLLSYVNLKLRDFYPDLEELCRSLDIEREELEKTMVPSAMNTIPRANRFV